NYFWLTSFSISLSFSFNSLICCFIFVTLLGSASRCFGQPRARLIMLDDSYNHRRWLRSYSTIHYNLGLSSKWTKLFVENPPEDGDSEPASDESESYG